MHNGFPFCSRYPRFGHVAPIGLGLVCLIGICLPATGDENTADQKTAAAPRDAASAQAALVGSWAIDKDSFRQAVLKGMVRDDQPVVESLRKLVDEIIEKSNMTLNFQADGKLKTTAKMANPLGGPPVESQETGTWKVAGMKDMAVIVQTVTVESESGEKQSEEVQVRFGNRDKFTMTIPSQKVELTFLREKKKE